MKKEYTQGGITFSLLALTALFSISPAATATTTHLCTSGAVSCDIPASTFFSGSTSLSGNAGGDTVIVDSGNTAYIPVQTFTNFGVLENHGTLNNGNSFSPFPWLRVMGPGAILNNHGITNNQSDLYVQNNSVLSTGAPEGSGKIYNHNGGVFNNGSSSTYTNPAQNGHYLYGGTYVFDDAEIINDGTFNNYSYIFTEVTATFTNNGTFNNYAQDAHGTEVNIEGTIKNTGTIHSMVGATMNTANLHNTSTGTFINEGKLESSVFPGFTNSVFTNEGQVEITSTGTGQAPNFYSPGTFSQTAGSLKVDGQFVQSQFDVQGGIVTGGGIIDTTNSIIPGTNPTVLIGPSAILMPGNGSDNELHIIGDVKLEGELIIELGDTTFDFLHIAADTMRNSSIGYLDLGGLLTISLLSDFSANVGDTYDIIAADGGVINDFVSSVMFTIGGYTFERIVNSNTVSLSVFSKSVSAVPLPATILLLAPVLIGFISLRRKEKTTAA